MEKPFFTQQPMGLSPEGGILPKKETPKNPKSFSGFPPLPWSISGMVFPWERRARRNKPSSSLGMSVVGPVFWGFLGCYLWWVLLPEAKAIGGQHASLKSLFVSLSPQLRSDAEPSAVLSVTTSGDAQRPPPP